MNKKLLVTLTIIIIYLLSISAYSQKATSTHAQTMPLPIILTISGLVQNPLNLTLSDLEAMPQTTEYGALYCVANPSIAIMQGNWTGVLLSYILQQANVSPSAVKVGLFAPDSFSTDFPAPSALQDNTTLLAYTLNNASLGQLQLVVPGDWGYKWITNPTQIQLFNYDFLGEYESQGYPDDGYSTPIVTNPLLTQTPMPTSTPAQNGLFPNYTNSPFPTSTPQLPKPTLTPTNIKGTSNQKKTSTFPFLIYASGLFGFALLLLAYLTVLRKRRKNQKIAT